MVLTVEEAKEGCRGEVSRDPRVKRVGSTLEELSDVG